MGLQKGQKHKGQFKKGQSGNPSGKRKLPTEVREARAKSYEEMVSAVIFAQNLTTKEYNKLKNEDIPLGDLAIIKAYKDCDYTAIKIYEDRLWGKAKDSVELSTGENSEITVNINGIDATFKNKLQS